jgi:hypothetical protein
MRTGVLLAAAFGVGCSVPDVTFLSDDASVEGGDAGDGAAGDSPSDGPNDGDAASYCIDGGAPPDGGVCCSPGVVCFGNCNLPNCAKCNNTCGASAICCAKGGNVPTCQQAPPPCP